MTKAVGPEVPACSIPQKTGNQIGHFHNANERTNAAISPDCPDSILRECGVRNPEPEAKRPRCQKLPDELPPPHPPRADGNSPAVQGSRKCQDGPASRDRHPAQAHKSPPRNRTDPAHPPRATKPKTDNERPSQDRQNSSL